MKRSRIDFVLAALTIAIVLIRFSCAAAEGAVLYVKQDSPGPVFDGTSWDTAFHTVQAGLNAAATGDEVWVAKGRYIENIAIDSVGLYGGFAGGETARDERDWEANETILDGNNYACVVYALHQCPIDGFTITNGYNSNFRNSGPNIGGGGGIYCRENSRPVISNNKIIGNTAMGQGGGILCDTASSPVITNNVITDNTALGYGGSGYVGGGGIRCNSASGAVISNNIIAGNKAGRSGGGICCTGRDITITHNVISGNQPAENSNISGGGIFIACSSGLISDNTISGNHAGWGGGVYCSGNVSVARNKICDNHAEGEGGGIHCYSTSFSQSVESNLISGNTVSLTTYSIGHAAGIYVYSETPASITGNTIVGNKHSDLNEPNPPTNIMGCGIYLNNGSATTPASITNNIIASNTYGIGSSTGNSLLTSNDIFGNMVNASPDLSSWPDGGGNLSVDPLFMDAANGDYRLRLDSPCIDAGTNTDAPATDILGSIRPLDGNGDGQAVCDIGAYEHQMDMGKARETYQDGASITLGAVSVTARFPSLGSFYVENADRAWGIKVNASELPAKNQLVNVTGTMQTDENGERYIQTASIQSTGNGKILAPLCMRNGWLGGDGITASADLTNIGLFVSTWGKVTSAGANYFYINDGSDGVGVKVKSVGFIHGYGVGDYAQVTGISSIEDGARVVLMDEYNENFTTQSTAYLTLYEGANLISFPVAPVNPDPEAVFAGVPNWSPDGNLQRWDAATQGLVAYDSFGPEPFGKMLFGDGCWAMSVPQDTQIAFESVNLMESDHWMSLPKAGWAILGNPMNKTLHWADFGVTDGSETLSLAAAVKKGLLSSEVLYWDAEVQGLCSVDLPPFAMEENLKPWHGYWVQSFTDKLALIAPSD